MAKASSALLRDPTQVPKVPGFRFAGGASGIKKNGDRDLALIVNDGPAPVAVGLFTTNKVVAAPVTLSRDHLSRAAGKRARVIVANSGNANACTGEAGMLSAQVMATAAADAVGVSPQEVLVASTGVIGAPLDDDRLQRGIATLAPSLRSDGIWDAAEAIRTTDTWAKVARKSATVGGKRCTVAGIAKGSGMIRPDMATMLAFVCTDAPIAAHDLRALVREVNADSFSRISVDGDMSTNDTLYVMSSGSAAERGAVADPEGLRAPLRAVCRALAKAMVEDGEGASHLVEVVVSGAKNPAQAERAARQIAGSPLVKTAIAAADPNWGRIAGAAGAAGVALDPDALTLHFDRVRLVAGGIALGPEAEARAGKVMARREYRLELNLGAGGASYAMWTCDLTHEYVRINAEYRT